MVLSETTVTASRLPLSVHDAPGTTVVDRDQIVAANATDLTALLRQVAGLHVDRPGGRGGITSVYLRGSDPNFTQVMVDGVKVNDPTNARGGSFDFSTLPVDSIERIEIVRGPVSSVHGSDALGGVINILTRAGAPGAEYSLDLGLGSHDLADGSITARGPIGERLSYALTVGHADAGDIVQNSRFNGSRFSGQLEIMPHDATHVRATLYRNHSRSESFPDDSGGPAYAVFRERDERGSDDLAVGLSVGHDVSTRLKLSARADYYRHAEDMISPGVAPGVRDPFGVPASSSDTRFSRKTAEVSGVYALSESSWMALGAETRVEEGTSDSEIIFFGTPVPTNYDLHRRTSSAFAEARLATRSGLTLHGGLRADLPEHRGSVVSPEISVMYRVVSTGTILTTSWGEGFKLPSFFALGHPIVGNPGLVPETSSSREASIEQICLNGRMTLSASVFSSRYRDIVDFHEGPPPQLLNRSQAAARGGEIEVDLSVDPSLSLFAHLSKVETDIRGTDEGLRNRPEWRGGLVVRWQPVSRLTIRFSALYVDEALDSSIPTGDRYLDSYTRTDLAGTWQVNSRLRVGIAIDNLLDEDYEQFAGFAAQRRQLRATAHIMLGSK